MNKRKLLLIISTTIILLIIVLGIIYLIDKDEPKMDNGVVEIIDKTEKFDYYLEEDATSYYKKLYDELKRVIGKNEIDYEEYAKIVAQLFVTDVFTLDNKISSNDIGGLQFIYPDFKEDFIKIAQTTLYSNVKSNIYGDRVQELPFVTNTLVTNIQKNTFTYKDKDYESYELTLTIEYKKDLGYPTEYTLVLIKNDEYLQVAKAE